MSTFYAEARENIAVRFAYEVILWKKRPVLGPKPVDIVYVAKHLVNTKLLAEAIRDGKINRFQGPHDAMTTEGSTCRFIPTLDNHVAQVKWYGGGWVLHRVWNGAEFPRNYLRIGSNKEYSPSAYAESPKIDPRWYDVNNQKLVYRVG